MSTMLGVIKSKSLKAYVVRSLILASVFLYAFSLHAQSVSIEEVLNFRKKSLSRLVVASRQMPRISRHSHSSLGRTLPIS